VERGQADQVLAVALELDALRLRQPLKRDLALEPFDSFVGDPGHGTSSAEKMLIKHKRLIF
jgi:hypothetical protein